MKKFKKINGEVIMDLTGYIKDFISEKKKSGITTEIHIGCDSQRHGKTYLFSTALCLRMVKPSGVGAGVHIISSNQKLSVDSMSVEQKLLKEVEYAVQTALDLREAGFNDKLITVHVDFNPDDRFISNKVLNQGTGWISGVGFEYERKPYAWAASYSGDRVAKNKFVK